MAEQVSRICQNRLAALAAVAVIFAALIALAPMASGNVRFAGLSNRTLHIIAHIIVWSGVTATLGRVFRGRLWAAWLIALSLSWLEETHQYFVPGRICSWRDYSLNFGIVTGAAILVFIFVRLRSKRRYAGGEPTVTTVAA